MSQPATAPFSLEAYPVVAKSSTGPAHYTVTVVNKGSKPLSINAHTTTLHGQCAQLRFTPQAFKLAPGHAQNVTVTATTSTSTDYLASFSGHVDGAGFGVGAAVGTRFIVGHPGTHTTVCAAPKATPLHQQPGFPAWAFAAIAAAVLLVLVYLVRRYLRHRHAAA